MKNRISLFVLAMFGVACGAPWKVITRSGPPSALLGAEAMTVDFDTSDLRLVGEPMERYLAEKSKEEVEKFNGVLETVEQGFMATLTRALPTVNITPAGGPLAPGELRLSVRFLDLDQGKYAFAYRRPSYLSVEITWSRDGEVVDAIKTLVYQDATIATPSIHQRMRTCAEHIAARAGRYFRSAQKP